MEVALVSMHRRFLKILWIRKDDEWLVYILQFCLGPSLQESNLTPSNKFCGATPWSPKMPRLNQTTTVGYKSGDATRRVETISTKYLGYFPWWTSGALVCCLCFFSIAFRKIVNTKLSINVLTRNLLAVFIVLSSCTFLLFSINKIWSRKQNPATHS